MNELIEEIKFLYEDACISKNINLSFKYQDSAIYTDKQRVLQVLVNLFNNSLKFTKPS